MVVIIRGGGATSDLNSFDSYLLAANCAQFPLPVITGIGHERDDTILDMVAHTRMKTPTAVAEFLIGRMDAAAMELEELQQDVSELATGILQKQRNFLQLLGTRLPAITINRIERNRSLLQMLGNKLPVSASAMLLRRRSVLDTLQLQLQNRVTSRITEGTRFIQLTEQFIKMASPDYVLKRGYSLALKDGKIIKHATELSSGDELVTRFADGDVKSIVKNKSFRYMTKKEETYNEAVEKLRKIVADIENGELDVDVLSEKVKEATRLIKLCKEKLYKVDEEVKRYWRNWNNA